MRLWDLFINRLTDCPHIAQIQSDRFLNRGLSQRILKYKKLLVCKGGRRKYDKFDFFDVFKIIGRQNLFQPAVYFLVVKRLKGRPGLLISELVLKEGPLLISDLRRGPLKEGEDI